MNSENSRNPNHLAGETSPYLKQHMYNPVDWYPWGEDAFKKALKEEKPIFLSIGYSTCHWCHVMAHESFEDEQIAKYLNEHFVSIKLDREERPDIDQIYQNIIQMMGKRGGWPLSIFMTSDQKPFFAGTYFPKEKKYGMETFLNILKQIVDLNQKRRYDLVHTGNQVLDTLEKLSSRTLDKSEDLSKDILQLAMVTLEPSFNSKYGGFGNAPKFPNFPALLFILRQISEETLDHPGKYSTIKHELENTLDKISAGGIFDHVGGGFARYSIDEQWMIPHFEKMLYDNAMALQVYSEAYYLFQKPRYKEVVRDTINWVFREMLAENIGFFSAIDADSEGEEGKYYVWSKEDLESIIPKENREKFFQAYGITESGNFERNTNHLYVADTKLIKENKDKFKPILKLLLTKRMQRTPPNVDNKILTSWSSMMVLGLFSAYKILNDKLILNIAHNVLQSIGTNLFSEEESILYRVLDPNTKRRTIIGHLDDYAYFIQALYQDFQYFPDISSINLIGKLIEVTIDQFWDASNEVFYYSSSKNLDLPTRLQSGSDMPLPNPNAVMAENLIRLHYYLGDPHNLIYLKKAESILSSFIESSYSQPIAYGAMLIAMQWYFYGSVDIMINDDFMPKDEILQQIHQFYIPRLHFWNKKSVPLELSSFASKFEFDSKYTFYLCLHFNCLPPTNNWNVFISQLKNNVFSI